MDLRRRAWQRAGEQHAALRFAVVGAVRRLGKLVLNGRFGSLPRRSASTAAPSASQSAGTGSRCYVARAAAAEWLGSTRCGSLGPHGRAVLWRGRGGRGALGGCGGVPGRSALARVPLRGALLAVGRRRRGDGARRDCLRRAQRKPRGAWGCPGADAASAGARPRGERSWRALGRGARDGGGGRGARALRARGGVDRRERVPGADARDGAVLRGAARGRRRALHRRGAPCRGGGGARPTRRARL